MKRSLLMIPLFGIATCCMVEEPMCRLPKPDYHQHPADPPWLTYAVRFHGHLGPWATAGLRAGMTGRDAVEARGYFDVEVTAEGPFLQPPQSCFLDGLQVATGATLGKRNLHWLKAEAIVVRVENTRTGKLAEIRPTAKLARLLRSLTPRPKAAAERARDREAHDHQDRSLEAIARETARLPDEEILTVTLPGDR